MRQNISSAVCQIGRKLQDVFELKDDDFGAVHPGKDRVDYRTSNSNRFIYSIIKTEEIVRWENWLIQHTGVVGMRFLVRILVEVESYSTAAAVMGLSSERDKKWISRTFRFYLEELATAERP